MKPGSNRNETGWSCMRGCIPDRFRYVSNLFHEWLKFRADTRIILVAYAAWLHSRFGFATLFSFMNGSSFEPTLGSFWSRMLRGCLRMLRGCVPDSVSLRFEFSFMNGSSFELCSDHFGVAMLAVRQELESQVQQAH